VISVAVMAAPLSLMAARAKPRFSIACDRPGAMFSADSELCRCRHTSDYADFRILPIQRRRSAQKAAIAAAEAA
jgi:hypothetical protein